MFCSAVCVCYVLTVKRTVRHRTRWTQPKKVTLSYLDTDALWLLSVSMLLLFKSALTKVCLALTLYDN